MRAVLTVVGQDRKGIIYSVSKCLNELNVNIEEISQTILQDYFTMIMIVDMKDSTSDFNTIQQKLHEVGKNSSVDVKIQHEDIFNSMHKL